MVNLDTILPKRTLDALSDRAVSIAESQTLVMAQTSRDLQEQGIDIINLSIGEPDFDTPKYIKEAAKKAIDDNFTHYSPVKGFKDLIQAISDKFKRENNLDYGLDEIIVSNGAKHSIANVILSLINYNDEVLIPAPYWVSYHEIVKIAEGKPVVLPTSIDNDFKVTPEQIQNAITNRTKAIFINSPSNPTGSVYTREELKAIADVLYEFEDIYIISDEIYEHILFEGKHASIGQFDFIKDRVITVNGVSKGYAMTGWRIGYIGAPKFVVDACSKIQGQYTSGPCTIAQKASVAALCCEQDDSKKIMHDAFLKRRNLVVERLAKMPGLKVNMPNGAFYVFPEVSSYFGKKYNDEYIFTAQDLAMYLLHEANVAVVPGDAFGSPNNIRLSYATSEENLNKALDRIENALAKL
ncbi:MAG: aspartate aminotransferase [Marinilabiliales bacterium]|nr:MAG: aspartate aminotransferase [Marinilabiliales bacterium]